MTQKVLTSRCFSKASLACSFSSGQFRKLLNCTWYSWSSWQCARTALASPLSCRPANWHFRAAFWQFGRWELTKAAGCQLELFQRQILVEQLQPPVFFFCNLQSFFRLIQKNFWTFLYNVQRKNRYFSYLFTYYLNLAFWMFKIAESLSYTYKIEHFQDF